MYTLFWTNSYQEFILSQRLQTQLFSFITGFNSSFSYSGFFRFQLFSFRFYRFQLFTFRVLQTPVFLVPGFADSSFSHSGFCRLQLFSFWIFLYLYSIPRPPIRCFTNSHLLENEVSMQDLLLAVKRQNLCMKCIIASK